MTRMVIDRRRHANDLVKAGYCPVCEAEHLLLGVIPASAEHPESLALDCGHAVPFPQTVAVRMKGDGTAVLYTDLATLRRVQHCERNSFAPSQRQLKTLGA